jgi:hypothetical protein
MGCLWKKYNREWAQIDTNNPNLKPIFQLQMDMDKCK